MRSLCLLLICLASTLSAQSASVTLVREIGAGESTSSPTFERIRSIAVGRDGRMYIADAGARAIKVVKPDGTLQTSIGRPGQGPGDFGVIGAIYIEKEQLIVPDPMLRRMSAFTLDGRPVRTWSTPAASMDGPASMRPMRDSAIVLASVARFDSRGIEASDPWVVVRVHSASRVDTLLRYRDDVAFWVQRGTSVWNPIEAGFGDGGAWATHGDSLLVVANGYTGNVQWYSIDRRGARLLRSAAIGRVATPTTARDVAVVKDNFRVTHTAPRYANMDIEFSGLPPGWSVASDAVFADNGSVWIASTERALTSNVWTIFPLSGGAPRVVSLPAGFKLEAVHGSLLYGSATNDDVPVVRVYAWR